MFTTKNLHRTEEGFSYIDVMVAIVILFTGIVALTSALTANLVRTYENENRIIAKQLALSTIESIISARDISRPGGLEGWHSIGNVGTNPVNGVNMGVVLTGWTPVREENGSDGIAGTADDACAGTGACSSPGGTSNTSRVIPAFERQIVITDVQDPDRPFPANPVTRRNIEVTVRFSINGMFRDETVSTLVANYE